MRFDQALFGATAEDASAQRRGTKERPKSRHFGPSVEASPGQRRGTSTLLLSTLTANYRAKPRAGCRWTLHPLREIHQRALLTESTPQPVGHVEIAEAAVSWLRLGEDVRGFGLLPHFEVQVGFNTAPQMSIGRMNRPDGDTWRVCDLDCPCRMIGSGVMGEMQVARVLGPGGSDALPRCLRV